MINIRPQIPKFVWYFICFLVIFWLITQLTFKPKAQFASNLNPSTICNSQQAQSLYSIVTNQGTFNSSGYYLPNVNPVGIREIQITPDAQCQSAIQPDRTYFVEFDIFLETFNYGENSLLIEWDLQTFEFRCTTTSVSGNFCYRYFADGLNPTYVSSYITNQEIRVVSLQGATNQSAASTSHFFNILKVDYSPASSETNGVLIARVKGVARPTNSGATTMVIDMGDPSLGHSMIIQNYYQSGGTGFIHVANIGAVRIVDYFASYEYQSMLALEDIATAIRDIPPGSGFDVVINRLEESIEKDESWRQEERDWREEEREWQRDTSSDDAQASINNVYTNFNPAEPPGLRDIVTAPLVIIDSLITSGCIEFSFPLPFTQGKVMTLPCLRQIYQNHLGGLLLMYDAIALGVISYWIVVRYIQWMKIFQHPKRDEVEVFDL